MKTSVSVLMVAVLAAGCLALTYARWTRPAADGDLALSAGQYQRALASYAAAEARFDRIPLVRQVFSVEYDRIVANQLWLLYKLERFDETIEKAERAPEGALPHFWSACALFHKGIAEQNTEARLTGLTRAEEEFRRAVEITPDDWDTKFDFELTTRLTTELRKQPKVPPNQLMELLRPQPKGGATPARRVG